MTIEEIFIRMLVALLAGVAIGFNRSLVRDEVSMRTFGLVSLGSCMFIVMSIIYQSEHNNEQILRTLSQVISGIGFLGAGFIFFSESEGKRVGMTTAASVWVSAAVGIASGMGYFALVGMGAGLALVTLVLFYYFEKRAISLIRNQSDSLS